MSASKPCVITVENICNFKYLDLSGYAMIERSQTFTEVKKEMAFFVTLKHRFSTWCKHG